MKKRCLFLFCVFVLATNVAVAATTSDSAERILDKSGIAGGLIVHLGCGDGKLTVDLKAGDQFRVHGLDTNFQNVHKARELIRSRSLGGTVTVQHWTGNDLPYNDNLVNLLVAEDLHNITMNEVMRVLVPNGVAYVKTNGKWSKSVKDRPEAIDEWTHYMHDAGGTCVSTDTVVAPPRGLQWVGSPKWSRNHDHASSMQAMVSAGGRIFYVADEGPTASIQLPAKWMLTARDAFNGTVLWKKELPGWFNHLFPLKSGPAYIPRRLVATENVVYIAPGAGKPLTALDAATGKLIKTYDATSLIDVALYEGVLYGLADPQAEKCDYEQEHSHCWGEAERARSEWGPTSDNKRLTAINAKTGKTLWKNEQPAWPMTLAVDGQYLALYDGKVRCLDRNTGKQIWESGPIKAKTGLTQYAPRMAIRDGAVYFSPEKTINVFDAATGEPKWTVTNKPRSGHQSIEDFFVMKDRVWVFDGKPKKYVSWNSRTGESATSISSPADIYYMHQRCYPGKATERFLLAPRTGTSFIDIDAESWQINHWTRGGCIYGVMPANGLLYLPPHACACYMQSKLSGLNSLTAGESKWDLKGTRHFQGPAFLKMPRITYDRDQTKSWPVFRHDNKRSNHVPCNVPDELEQKWKTKIGGKLTQPVVALGKIFLASVDEHTVYAFDENTGAEVWHFIAGGRIDSPPTIFAGKAIFGCADGHVYALRVDDGQLEWRYRAAPGDRNLISYDQIESVWPLHGSVLAANDTVYCVAGRSMFLDGGMTMVRLDAETGRLVSETKMDRDVPGTDQTLEDMMNARKMPVASKDILSSDGDVIFMKTQPFTFDGKRATSQVFSKEGERTQEESWMVSPFTQRGDGVHLFSPTSFLDDSWYHRSYWIYGRGAGEVWEFWHVPGRLTPTGRIMVFDDDQAYGYSRDPEYLTNSSVLEYRLYGSKLTAPYKDIYKKIKNDMTDWRERAAHPEEELTTVEYNWKVSHPSLVARAMVVTNNKLLVAGPPDVVDEKEMWGKSNDPLFINAMKDQTAALAGKKGAILWSLDKSDGDKKTTYDLDSTPVFDGMIVANGKVFITTIDGHLECLDKK